MSILSKGCGGGSVDTGLSAFIRKIGKGPKLAQDLTFNEAKTAMDIILSGQAEPAQIGAFLVAARIKSESATETAGMLTSLRNHSQKIEPNFPILVELAGAHDGKNKSLVLAPFVARALHQTGIPVLITGGHNVPTKLGITAGQVAKTLGWHEAQSGSDALQILEQTGFAYWDMQNICPALENLKSLRVSLGLRTVFNTIEKLINPARATHLITGVYHGPYLKTVAEALQRVGEKNILCVQATEASTDLPLKKRVLYRAVTDGIISEQAEIDPESFGLKNTANPEFENLSAENVITQVKQAITSGEGLVYDALLYNISVLLWWLKITPDIPSSLAKARTLITPVLLFV